VQPETKAEKFILDPTAGYRMCWFNKKQPNTIYLDQRPECAPDIVGDFRDLSQFPDNTFRLIVFDPPHILKTKARNLVRLIAQFGALEPDTWKQDLRKGFDEMWRVLAPYGVLLLKWNTHQISASELLVILGRKPLVYQISSSKGRREFDKLTQKHSSGTYTLQTLWFCFMKIPETPRPKGGDNHG
jgi:hypothetical protein